MPSVMIGAVDDRPAPDDLPGASRPGPMTRRLAAATLLGQALSVFLGALVAWQLEEALGGDTGVIELLLLGGVSVLCLLAAGALRTRAGVALGWACQLLTLAGALLLPAMAVVAVIFGLLWWGALRAGARIDSDRAAWATGAGAAYPSQDGTGDDRAR